MPTAIPFSEETFIPISLKGNRDKDHPVEFDINAVGGPSRARLKSIVVATSGLAQSLEWSPATQAAVIESFRTGAPVFAEGVTTIRNLTAPAALCLKAGLLAELPKGTNRQSQIPITTGAEYAAVCGYMPLLSFEVAMAISKISGQAEVDPAFFGSLTRSLSAETRKTARGTAPSATSPSGADATAGSSTARRARRQPTT